MRDINKISLQLSSTKSFKLPEIGVIKDPASLQTEKEFTASKIVLKTGRKLMFLCQTVFLLIQNSFCLNVKLSVLSDCRLLSGSGGRWMCVTSLGLLVEVFSGWCLGGFADVLLTVCSGRRQLGMQSQRSSVSR